VFSISEQADRYATYVLKDSSTAARLEVVPERGGLITRWQVAGQDILYFDAERFADPSKSVRGGIPILFPICGNLPENQYTWAGQTYTLKQHGFARDLPWTVADRAIEPSAVALTLTLTSTEQTRRQYPFDFQLQFTYRLRGRELALEQTFQNTGDRPMPFATGLHPYFWVQDKAALQFDLPATTYINHLTQQEGTYTGSFDWQQAEIDLALQPLQAQQAAVQEGDQGTRLQLAWSDAYQALVFWAVQGKDYYCLEPWTALRNAMNTGDRLITLEPGESRTLTVTLSV
jgi:galactose mutarotase-like enzyme